MTTYFIRSTDGNNLDSGLTWALAKHDLDSATGAGSVGTGHFFAISQDHAESLAATKQWNANGTAGAPARFLCVNDADASPTTQAYTGTISITGANFCALNQDSSAPGGYHHWEGVTVNCGLGASSNTNIYLGNNGSNHIRAIKCNFVIQGTGTTSSVSFGNSANCHTKTLDCGYKFANSNQFITINGYAAIVGGSLLSGGTSPGTIFVSGSLSFTTVLGMDLSNLGSSSGLHSQSSGGGSAPGNGNVIWFRILGSKLPSGWSGNLVGATPFSHNYAEMFKCKTADGTVFPYWKVDQFGVIKQSTSVYRNDGATEHGTPYCLTLDSNSRALYPINALITPDLYIFNDDVGVPITLTVEILNDGLTLTNKEAVLEAFYMADSDSLVLTHVTSDPGVLPAASNLSTSSVTWTGGSFSSPVKQKISVTFTPQREGLIMFRVMNYRPGRFLYLCPKATIS